MGLRTPTLRHIASGVADHVIDSLRPNLSLIRTRSAARRALILGAVYVLGTSFIGNDAGVALALGALFGGVLDRGDTSIAAATRATLGLAGVVFITQLGSGLVSATPVLSVSVVALCAALAGLSASTSMSAARVFAYSAILGVVNVFVVLTPAQAVAQATLVTAGVLAQAIGIALSIPLALDVVERRRLSRAIRTTANVIGQHQAVDSEHAYVLAINALCDAESVAVDHELSDAQARAYLNTTAALDRILSVWWTRKWVGSGRDFQSFDAHALGQVADGLHAAAEAVARRRRLGGGLLRHLLIQRGTRSGEGLAGGEDLSVRRNHDVVLEQVSDLLQPGERRAQTPGVGRWYSVRRHWRRPGRLQQRQALRLAVATIAGSAVTALYSFNEASWIAMTTIVLLRPDVAVTTKRTIASAVGTLVGAGAAIAVDALVPSSQILLTASIVIFALVGFVLEMVNYLYLVGGTVAVTILVTANVSGDGSSLGWAQIVDVTVGSLLALAISSLIPVWSEGRLARALAPGAAAAAREIEALASDAGAFQRSGDVMAGLSRKMRQARLKGARAVDTSSAEPRHGSFDRARAREISDALTSLMCQLQPLRVLVAQAGGLSESNASVCRRAAGSLDFAAHDLLTGETLSRSGADRSDSPCAAIAGPATSSTQQLDGEALDVAVCAIGESADSLAANLRGR